jgi:DNA primase
MKKTKNFTKHDAGAPANEESNLRSRFSKQAERLLREVPIARVVGEYTPLHKSKKGLAGNCPRHHEVHRTLRLDPRSNTFYCSFCGMRGDALTFLEKVEELTRGQALEALERIKYSDEYRDAA